MRSGFEAKIKKDLESREIPFEYETMKLNYIKKRCPHCSEVVDSGVYTPDFIIGTLIIEGKGNLDSETRTKMKQVKACNPDLDIRFLFQRDNKITKASKTHYTDWATKYGFPSAVGHIVPEEWLTDEITGRNKSTTKATKKRKQ
jgi:hypothetical protein